ncbi:MAG: FAD-dependent oxidoreductase [Spirochaetaceae bacterium]|nr:FAD-dependent oxidoreductase [Spirochaetaceae bacterium]
MNIAVIGCTHAGTAAIVNAAQLYPEAKITVYERNDNISFLSCGIALYVGGFIEDSNGLFYSSPDKLKELGVNTKMKHEVINADLDSKTLTIKNLDNGETHNDSYDKLIITTGSWPLTPPIKGIDLENIVLSKNFDHSNTIIEKSKKAEKVVVIGAGYIGVELVEAFKHNGKDVTLIDAEERILSKYLDRDNTDAAEEALKNEGINLALNQKVHTFEGVGGKVTKVLTDKGEYEADLVILCIGFRPNTGLFKDQIDMLDNGAIVVDPYMRTSRPDVFAAGDSCSVIFNPTGSAKYIPLATNAVRMGTLVAKNLIEPTVPSMGTQGTSGIKIYDLNIASTGLTVQSAELEGMDVDSVTIEENHRPEFMPDVEKVRLTLVFEKDSKRIVGAQLRSKIDLTQSINTMSVCIQNKMTVAELALTDFFFQPHYNKPWNFLNQAGLAAMEK